MGERGVGLGSIKQLDLDEAYRACDGQKGVGVLVLISTSIINANLK